MNHRGLIIPILPWITLMLTTIFLAGCANSAPAPAIPQPSATSDQPAPVQPALTTEPSPVPLRTFVVVETLVPQDTIGEPMKPTPANPYIANLVQQAQQDLAKRLSIPVESIELLKFEDVIWPDGGLGCPQPGMAYTQVLVEGYRMLLQYDGQVYAYHGGGGRPPFLCQNPQK